VYVVGKDGYGRTLIWGWDGTRWSAANAPVIDGQLTDITATSPSTLVAIGYAGRPLGYDTGHGLLAMHAPPPTGTRERVTWTPPRQGPCCHARDCARTPDPSLPGALDAREPLSEEGAQEFRLLVG
jgi:hypothetical protein